MESKNLIKFTLVVISTYFLIQIYLLFGTWLTSTVTMIAFLIIPFIIGYFVALMLAPSLQKLSKLVKLKPSVILALVLLAFIALLALVGTFFITELFKQIANLTTSLINATDANIKRIDEISNQIGFDLGKEFNITGLITNVGHFFANNSSIISSVTSKMFSSVLGAGSFLLFFILTLFYTIDSIEEKKQHQLACLKERGHTSLATLFESIEQIFRYYFRGMFISMLFVAAGSSIGFWMLGLPNPVGLGIICGLFNIIPLVGPYIGAFPAGFVALSHGWLPLLYVILVVLVVQQIEGNFVTPNVQGKFLNIQPISIIAGIVVFGALFGVVGMIFAAPIAAIIKVSLQYGREKLPMIRKWWDKIVHSA